MAASGTAEQAADVKLLSEQASLVNALIPDLIKRRAGTLPSLRKTLSVVTVPWTPIPTPMPPSPPPPYPSTEDGEVDSGSDAGSVSDVSETAGHVLKCQTGMSDTIYAAASETSTSGVRWKYVGEGDRLIECAGREAASTSEDPELARKMYIDGVGYLLNALPTLTPSETTQLVDYLPAALRQSSNDERDVSLQLLDIGNGVVGRQKNYVYQFTTIATMYGVLLASYLLPLLKRFVAMMYRCDQRYHVSKRVTDTTSQTVASLGKRVYTALNEGRTGQIALGMTLYTIDGASRGILEGYAQAVKRQMVVSETDVAG